jgi:GntP family gluconate:H+ symporter
MIIPTPGPVAVGESFKLGSGPFVLYSLIIALPASLAGWIYSKYLGKKKKLFAVEEDEEEGQLNENKPSVLLSFTVLLLPILLILFGTVFARFLSEGSVLSRIFSFFGDKNIALLIGVLFALVTLKRYYIRSANELINQAIGSAGMILMITGVGGSFGTIINQSGIGEYLVYSLTLLNMPLLLVGFLLAAIFRGAQGSSTVALITAATILAPSVMNTPGVNPYMVAIAITLGGMCCSFPNDSGFWVVSKFSNLSVKQTLLSWTVGNSIAGIVGFIILLIISILF